MAAANHEPTAGDCLVDGQTSHPMRSPVQDLYTPANYFLGADWYNPKRVRFADSLGVASVGQEIEGSHYRLTDVYTRDGGGATHVPGLVAVEQVPDEAVEVNSREERIAADNADNRRLWRIRPITTYTWGGYDEDLPAVIEDLAATPLEWSDISSWHEPSRIEYHMPYRNFRNELLEGEQLDHAQHIIGELLGKLDITLK